MHTHLGRSVIVTVNLGWPFPEQDGFQVYSQKAMGNPIALIQWIYFQCGRIHSTVLVLCLCGGLLSQRFGVSIGILAGMGGCFRFCSSWSVDTTQRNIVLGPLGGRLGGRLMSQVFGTAVTVVQLSVHRLLRVGGSLAAYDATSLAPSRAIRVSMRDAENSQDMTVLTHVEGSPGSPRLAGRETRGSARKQASRLEGRHHSLCACVVLLRTKMGDGAPGAIIRHGGAKASPPGACLPIAAARVRPGMAGPAVPIPPPRVTRPRPAVPRSGVGAIVIADLGLGLERRRGDWQRDRLPHAHPRDVI